ncbi:mycothiol synthase [Nocardioides bruguierae]|uniref:Mycothiol acetyltransferase n=1 Tax=Nocardioides bruguierae TaxID=2945102 RepID=A0A9X2DBB2_9ACTN|nr:mycothiol synthase [Nocardioides bruguierae]MCM0622683.1 mycothiol synthase [Nocardioides bruguierae]
MADPRIDSLALAAERADGTAPLDEATRMTLRHHPDEVTALVEDEGFALLTGGEITLVVDPEHRGRGVGARLLGRLLEGVEGPLAAWSHADHPAARALAAHHGFERVRELWVMRRPASEPLPPLEVPDGVVVRGFDALDPADPKDLLAVNAAAFAHHPEQGSMDAANLAERMAEPWFSSPGLLMAREVSPRPAGVEGEGPVEGALLGFHWTKQHDAATGEVYVVGVSPDAQGRGLGAVLTNAGLHHLHGLGVDEVILYVESDNHAAVRVYEGKLGFTHAPEDTHVMYRRS